MQCASCESIVSRELNKSPHFAWLEFKDMHEVCGQTRLRSYTCLIRSQVALACCISTKLGELQWVTALVLAFTSDLKIYQFGQATQDLIGGQVAASRRKTGTGEENREPRTLLLIYDVGASEYPCNPSLLPFNSSPKFSAQNNLHSWNAP